MEQKIEILRNSIEDMLDKVKTPTKNMSPMSVCLVLTNSGLRAFVLNNIKEWVAVGDSSSPIHQYTSLQRLRSYLYRVQFDILPEYDPSIDFLVGGCSSYVENGKLYRNLDWRNNYSATYIVEYNNFTGTAFLTLLEDGDIDDRLINQLPYNLSDGVNSSGIKISVHVLYNDWGWEGSGNMPITKLGYWLLTNITSMDTFEADVNDILSDLKVTSSLKENDILLQFLVTDGETTYVILPPTNASGNYTVVNATNNPKLTNFRWVSNAQVDRSDDDIQEHPNGIERWNMMPCELESLRYSIAYEEPTRLSDFIGEANTSKHSSDEQLIRVFEIAHENYLISKKQRDNIFWQTMHSVVYFENTMEHIYVQEDFNTDYIN